jgi:hypothetical protein
MTAQSRTRARASGHELSLTNLPADDDDVAVLRRRLDEQASLVAVLQRCVVDLDNEVAELRSLLVRTQCEVIRRLGELRTPPWAARDGVPPDPAPGDAAPPAGEEVSPVAGDTAVVADGEGDRPVAPQPALDPAQYARLVDRTRALVRTVVPAGAVVAVVSRGDDRLVDVDGRVGWHVPRTADGRWAGHHPTDSAAAVAALEDLRRRGARYLVFPSTTRWWLDYYGGLRRHLDETARVLVDRPDTCTVYALDR